MLEVLLRVGKIGLTLLEERFRLPEGEPEEPFHLAACQRPFTVPLYCLSRIFHNYQKGEEFAAEDKKGSVRFVENSVFRWLGGINDDEMARV